MSFKVCSNCGQEWADREQFICDRDLRILGYQEKYGEENLGVFLFQHHAPDCLTSLGVKAHKFADMHPGNIFEDAPRGDCPLLCRRDEDAAACPKKCECSFVADVLDRLKPSDDSRATRHGEAKRE